MPIWIWDLIAVAALVVIAPLIALAGKRHGRRIRGSLMMASILLGFGHALDPPPQEKVEASEPGKDARSPGDPPTID
jgi:hypothetical protein